MVRKRVALGLGVSAGFLLLALLDSALPGGPIFHIFVGLTLIGTLLEVYGLAERHGEEPMKALPAGLLVAFVAWDYAARLAEGDPAQGPLGHEAGPMASFYGPMGLAVAASFLVIGVAHLLARDPYRWLAGAPASIFGLLYVWFFGSHFFPIRGMGMGYVLAVLAASKMGDAGAYLVGTHWGHRRLAPRTSPNKTLEGAAAGLAASVLGSVVFALIFNLGRGIGFWVLFGLVVGIAAQLGDLVASAIKRSAGAKDSGSLIPILGGVLDVVDSPLLSAPVAYWLLAC